MAQCANQSEKQLRLYLLSSLFAALTAVGAFIKIPLQHVDVTLQTFFVILAGSLLGPKFGALSQIFYLVVGLLGVPIFSRGGGPGYIFQPTFGYLLGYPIAAYIIGYMVWGNKRFKSSTPPTFLRIVLSESLGVLIIFLFGVTILYFNFKILVGTPISLRSAIWTGFLFFIPGDIVKIFLSSLIALKLNRILNI